MSEREEAIKKLLDDGADLTEENIQAVMKPEKPALDLSKELLNTLNSLNKNIDLLRDEMKTQKNKEFRIPEIKIPEIKVPQATIIQPDRPRRKLSFSFIRDQNGNIISATATEE